MKYPKGQLLLFKNGGPGYMVWEVVQPYDGEGMIRLRLGASHNRLTCWGDSSYNEPLTPEEEAAYRLTGKEPRR